MRRFVVHIVLFQIILVTQLYSWGYDVHRRISRAAIQVVTGEFGDFLINNVNDLSYNAANPDFWKSVDPNEFPRHFIDADLYDDYPFDNIPRDLDSLYTKYGEGNVNYWGIAPWVIEDFCSKITALIKDGSWEESVFAMSAMSHYIADLHMPLHTCSNYNGQLTGNEGIHFRWETSMVEQYVTYIEPTKEAEYVKNCLSMAFSIVKESFEVYPDLIRADSIARSSLTKVQADSLNSYEKLSFEDEYLSVLYTETSDIVHDRLNKAAERIASYWYTCWVNAGSPSIPNLRN